MDNPSYPRARVLVHSRKKSDIMGKKRSTAVAHTDTIETVEAAIVGVEDTTVQKAVAEAVKASPIVCDGLDAFQPKGRGNSGGGGRKSAYPIRTMEVGDKFFVSLEGKKEATCRANLTTQAKHAGRKLSINKGTLADVDGLLVTRVS